MYLYKLWSHNYNLMYLVMSGIYQSKHSKAFLVGIEPTTNRLTADCSTVELQKNGKLAEIGFEPMTLGL